MKINHQKFCIVIELVSYMRKFALQLAQKTYK